MALESRPRRSATLVEDFDYELREAARAHGLRQARRCLTFAACVAAVALLIATFVAWTNDSDQTLTLSGTAIRLSLAVALIAAITILPLRRLRRGIIPSDRIERRVALLLALFPFAFLPYTPELRIAAATAAAAMGYPLKGLALAPFFLTLVAHVIACSFLPLRWREVFLPIIPFVTVSVIGVLFFDPLGYRLQNATLVLAVAIGIALPGAGICLLRIIRFRRAALERAVRERYVELREDLDVARRIHDRLLPEPIVDGPLEVDLAYEPMREIGGDLAFLHRSANGATHVVLIDVTGHGIAAALAVNRLHGELLRLTGTTDDPAPKATLASLNDYLRLTTARDSMYATAIVVRVDPVSGSLRYASAAHPDALIVGGDGRIQRLASTTCMLGACPAEFFDEDEGRASLAAGDSLLLYTDGLSESQPRGGTMLGIEGIERMVTAEPDATAATLMARLRSYRDGDPQDDCIILRARRRATAQ